LIASLVRSLVAAAVVLTAAAPIHAAPGQAPVAALHLLDVPYLPQSELLCGGAAAAMVLRYWGATNIYAESFADLVDPAAGGIRGDALLGAVRSRGWSAESFRGDRATIQESLRARHPVIVLIEDRPGRFHYVVVVGWSAERVIVHDPARAPFRVLDADTFEASWKASNYWAVAPLPLNGVTTGPPVAAPESTIGPLVRPNSDAPCAGMVDEGVRLAGAGDVSEARRIFEVAAESCPDAAGPWREMAGLHVLGSDWPAAATDARKALEREPADALAARILATALFLDNDSDGALAAWNRVGEPLVDLIRITGLERTRYAVAAGAIAVRPQTTLTLSALRTARRRLADLPAAQTTRVAFTPQESGRARVDAVVLERPLVPRSPVALGAVGLRALTDRELAVDVASPTGGGELWRGSWRWWERRPRLALGFDAPAPFGGVWGVSLFGERQTYGRQGSVFEESRRRLAFTFSNWTSAGLRWEGSVALDRMRAAGSDSGGETVAISATAQQRLDRDRAFVEARVGYWAGGEATSLFALRSEWRSQTANEGVVWIARAGADRAGTTAPLALWPGAGTGQGRDVLLRAHRLLDHGIVRGESFGRQLLHGGVEVRRWAQLSGKPVRLAPALFIDAARASHGLETIDAADRRWQFDAGAGIRLAVPGSGVMRIDIAHGLRDGRTAFSVGWLR
jgi:hypothetical protein